MNIVFRTDASSIAGTGHVIRCLTLARALRERGAVVSFVCRKHTGHLCALILEMGFALHALERGDERQIAGISSPAHASWLGASWEQDAAQFLAFLETIGLRPDWLVVDHYAIDYRWETCLRPAVGRIMVIDDLADRPHDCDMLLDQNLVAQMKARYDDKVPPNCRKLLGPQYALLQLDYAERRAHIAPRNGAVRRIFIYFGGADTNNLTGRSLRAVLSLERPDIEIDVVVSAVSPHIDAIRQQVEDRSNVHLYSGLSTLASLIESADLGIGAGGATNWERLCLGLPSIVIALAANQIPVATELERRGLIRFLQDGNDVDEVTIAKELALILEDGLSNDWSLQCLTVVDGCGAERVCAAMVAPGAVHLRSRPATPLDEDILLEWANEPTTRRNALVPAKIDSTTHHQWFQRRLENKAGCRIYIAETDEGLSAGQVRLERVENSWEVHYALSPAFRGRGLGRQMLEQALAKFIDEIGDASIFGRVKSDNRPSLRVFDSLGFSAMFNEQANVVTVGKFVQRKLTQPTPKGQECK
ncbi:UDP-2,4-diacetamido-2,4,6-trideoxy-beta-L-altropyranose hydrolase [Polaromonas sp. AER18D-145]|uniref:UDP-2,4-diacetamido-2,4, 6-trideoxy-beta-L-altropyranose hydrolase n=1 Tax=Polaromonas sp. AER18D-145 TaxID=1977060 RepID=UPI000BBC1E8D|nr:UDP-2,4-diacetamido-2,4,6-trideoxy-beta-L-altropyranose hydrolase [Polaromonas sp. AER18D-145]